MIKRGFWLFVLILTLAAALTLCLVACDKESDNQQGTPGDDGPAAETPAEKEGWELRELVTGQWEVTGYHGDSSVVTVPSANGVGAVVSIAEGAFDSADGVTEVTLPESVVRIAGGAFAGSSVAEVAYEGSLADWYDEVYMAAGWNDGAAFDAVICSDGTFDIALALYSNGLTFGQDGTSYYALGYFPSEEELTDTLVIPAVYKGMPVTAVKNLSLGASDEAVNAVKKVVITGNNMREFAASAFKDFAALEEITVPDSVTEIGSAAFFGCASLVNISVPDTVTSIGEHAFAGCAALETVELPQSLEEFGYEVFADCSALVSCVLPDTLDEIPDRTFRGCTSLEEINIPTGVRSIGSLAFSGCSSLTDVDLTGVTSVGGYAFDGCTSLSVLTGEDGIRSLGEYAFLGCGALSEFAFSESLDEIPDYAFSGCGALGAVSIPSSVERIGESAFSGCENVSELSFGGTVAEWNWIEKGANWNAGVSAAHVMCSNGAAALQSVIYLDGIVLELNENGSGYTVTGYSGSAETIVIPEEYESIPVTAINQLTGNSAVVHLELPDSVTEISILAFLNWKALETVVMPANLTEIPEAIFRNCTSLREVDLGDSVTTIGQYAFDKCTSLASLDLPDSVETIKTYAFCDCSALEDIDLSGVRTIGDSAFLGCSALVTVDLESVVEVGDRAFSHCTSLDTLTLGDGCVRVGSDTCQGCLALRVLNLPASLSEFGDNPFGTTNAGIIPVLDTLEVINYGGTIAQWETVKDTVTEGVSPSAEYVVNCSDGIAGSSSEDIPEGMEFELNGDMTGYVVTGYDGTAEELIIPGEYEGKPVVAVESLAAGTSSQGNSAVTKVVIPDSVMALGNGLFKDWTALREVVVSENVTELPQELFYGCEALTSVNLSSSLYKIGMFAFVGCSSLAELDLPATVTELERNTFVGTALTSVSLPNVVTVPELAFSGCRSLVEVSLPSAETISRGVFMNCESLTSAEVPNAVTVGEQAFLGCESLTLLELPKAKTIGNNAFQFCDLLKELRLGASVRSIGSNAFLFCDEMGTIYYEGTEEEWALVDDAGVTSAIKIVFSGKE